MFTSILKKPELYNKELRQYCLQSTNDSIKRIVQREKKVLRFNLVEKDNYPDDPSYNNNYTNYFLYFLSTSTFAYYLYKRNI